MNQLILLGAIYLSRKRTNVVEMMETTSLTSKQIHRAIYSLKVKKLIDTKTTPSKKSREVTFWILDILAVEKYLSQEIKVKRDNLGRIAKGSVGIFLGKKHNKNTIKKLSDSHKGYIMPESQKEKIKIARKKQIMKPLSQKTKNKISEKRMGMRATKDTREKISKSNSVEKHWNWKGGVTPLNKRIRSSSLFKIWRETVFLRDNFKCQNKNCTYCNNKIGVFLHPHHIKSFSEFPELRFDINNGITYCREFHINSKTLHKNIRRKKNVS